MTFVERDRDQHARHFALILGGLDPQRPLDYFAITNATKSVRRMAASNMQFFKIDSQFGYCQLRAFGFGADKTD